jgi:hypothetical protein
MPGRWKRDEERPDVICEVRKYAELDNMRCLRAPVNTTRSVLPCRGWPLYVRGRWLLHGPSRGQPRITSADAAALNPAVM